MSNEVDLDLRIVRSALRTAPESHHTVAQAVREALDRRACPGIYMNIAYEAAIVALSQSASSFQSRVQPWMMACFGAEVAADQQERNHRFAEEANELVQSKGMTREEAHLLVDYTWDRPVGEPYQEVGGVMTTLAALCLASGMDMHAAAETELARINQPTTIEKIRAKQASKPKHSPLPAHVETGSAHHLTVERRAELFDHMLAVAKANGFESITAAIAKATKTESAKPVEFPYQRTFDAIAAASSVTAGSISVSVAKFQEAFNRSQGDSL